MNKDNVFKSSNFYMNEGDKLTIIFKDETGTVVDVDLRKTVPAGTELDEVPGQVLVTDATNETVTSFSANWNFMENTTGYYLDVATDSAFTSYVTGYENKDVGNVITDSVTGLTGLVTYYYRIRGYNDIGTGVDSTTISTTTVMEEVVDIDGNSYTYITVGSQQWLIENLKTTTYADGTAIPNLTVNADWLAEDGTGGHDGAYCWHNNNIANKTDYGALYNWYAVDNAHGLAPTGWRVASATDWDALQTLLGGGSVAGGYLKEVDFDHWDSPNTDASDSIGFKALGSGNRFSAGTFVPLKARGDYQTSTEYDSVSSHIRRMLYNDGVLSTDYGSKKAGAAVRCMRDI